MGGHKLTPVVETGQPRFVCAARKTYLDMEDDETPGCVRIAVRHCQDHWALGVRYRKAGDVAWSRGDRYGCSNAARELPR